jgi:very-short-patch-repair endonuclease
VKGTKNNLAEKLVLTEIDGMGIKALGHLFAKNLRRRQTYAEQIFWAAVRNRKLLGKRFLRQYPIKFNFDGKDSFFIADFYCHEARLIIELDGEIHDSREDYDELRDQIIYSLGIIVLRFKNKEIENNFAAVIEKIKEYINNQSLTLNKENRKNEQSK